jgi:hypothetical protein
MWILQKKGHTAEECRKMKHDIKAKKKGGSRMKTEDEEKKGKTGSFHV